MSEMIEKTRLSWDDSSVMIAGNATHCIVGFKHFTLPGTTISAKERFVLDGLTALKLD